MRYYILTIISLLIASWSFSQTGYPRKLVLDNGDTVIAITVEQMYVSTVVYLQYREYKELNDSLLPYIDSCTALVGILNRMNTNLSTQLVITDSIVTDKSAVITEASSMIKKQSNKIHRLQTISRVLGGLAAGLTVALLLIL